MPRVKLLPGMHYNAWDPGIKPEDVKRQQAPRCWGGSVINISDGEFAAFGDKFEIVPANTKAVMIRDRSKMARS